MLYMKIVSSKSSIILMAVFTLLLTIIGVYLPVIIGLSESLIKFINGPLDYDKIMNTESISIYTSSIPLQIPLSFYMLSNKSGFAADIGLASINNSLTIALGLDARGYSILGIGHQYPKIIIGEKLASKIGLNENNNVIIVSSTYCNRILISRVKITSLPGVLNKSIIMPLNVSLKLNCRLPNTVSAFYIVDRELVYKYLGKTYVLKIIVPANGRVIIQGLDGTLFYENYVSKGTISLVLPFGGYIVGFQGGNISYQEEILLTNDTSLEISYEGVEHIVEVQVGLEKKTCVDIFFWDGRRYNGTIIVSLGNKVTYYRVINGKACFWLSNGTYNMKLVNSSIPLVWKITAGENKSIFIPPTKIIRRIEPSLIQAFLEKRGLSYKYLFLAIIGLGASVIISLLLLFLLVIIPVPLIVGKSVSMILYDYYNKLLLLSNNRETTIKVMTKYVLSILLISVMVSLGISYMLNSGRKAYFTVYETPVNTLYSLIGVGIVAVIIVISTVREFKKWGTVIDYYEH